MKSWDRMLRVVGFLPLLALASPGLPLGLVAGTQRAISAETADLIVHHARVVTVNADFAIEQAVAVAGERILAVGSNEQILALADANTRLLDAQGRTLLPGLIDSHVHATAASMMEYDHPIPTMESIADVLEYIRQRVEALEDGEWIRVSQVFVTRLVEPRFPTRQELDEVAPNNPVIFRTGPDAALNSLALELSGIDENFQLPAGINGRLETEPGTGRLTGLIRSADKFLKVPSPEKNPSQAERARRLQELLADYNSVGLTSISDRNASDSAVQLYQQLKEADQLSCRVYLYYGINAADSLPAIQQKISAAAAHPLHAYDNRLWLRGIKVFLDGGMLTGSASMHQPWGVSQTYGISDPEYKGIQYIAPEKLYHISKLALANDLQMTAHAVGDAAVDLLVNTYATIDRDDFPVRDKRPCVTHANFMTPDAIRTMAKLGIVADLQPAWLWLDGATLRRQFGDQRLQWFQPYRTLFDNQVVVGGGSDHMQKMGSMRAVNPYNPFLGMWIALTRQTRRDARPIHPAQSISREEMIRLYTINNAWLTFEEDQKGSLEPGKLADMILLDTDIMHCDADSIKDIRVLQTFVGGALVYHHEG